MRKIIDWDSMTVYEKELVHVSDSNDVLLYLGEDASGYWVWAKWGFTYGYAEDPEYFDNSSDAYDRFDELFDELYDPETDNWARKNLGYSVVED